MFESAVKLRDEPQGGLFRDLAFIFRVAREMRNPMTSFEIKKNDESKGYADRHPCLNLRLTMENLKMQVIL